MRNESLSHPESARALRLEYLSITLAALEAIVALVSGLIAGSVALVAFGADSVIEMLSAIVVISQLLTLVRGHGQTPSSEHRSHRILAVLFYALALYVVASVLQALVGAHHPRENTWGFAISLFSSVAMPTLAWRKRNSGRELAAQGLASLSRLMSADATETALCAILAATTLMGVSLAWLHWWWADPVASLAVVYFALREGREAWECASREARD